MNQDGHRSNGQFAAGNPGRPPRYVERDYLATLSEAVTPERWRQIVERALADAGIRVFKIDDWYANAESLKQQ